MGHFRQYYFVDQAIHDHEHGHEYYSMSNDHSDCIIILPYVTT